MLNADIVSLKKLQWNNFLQLPIFRLFLIKFPQEFIFLFSYNPSTCNLPELSFYVWVSLRGIPSKLLVNHTLIIHLGNYPHGSYLVKFLWLIVLSFWIWGPNETSWWALPGDSFSEKISQERQLLTYFLIM